MRKINVNKKVMTVGVMSMMVLLSACGSKSDKVLATIGTTVSTNAGIKEQVANKSNDWEADKIQTESSKSEKEFEEKCDKVLQGTMRFTRCDKVVIFIDWEKDNYKSSTAKCFDGDIFTGTPSSDISPVGGGALSKLYIETDNNSPDDYRIFIQEDSCSSYSCVESLDYINYDVQRCIKEATYGNANITRYNIDTDEPVQKGRWEVVYSHGYFEQWNYYTQETQNVSVYAYTLLSNNVEEYNGSYPYGCTILYLGYNDMDEVAVLDKLNYIAENTYLATSDASTGYKTIDTYTAYDSEWLDVRAMDEVIAEWNDFDKTKEYVKSEQSNHPDGTEEQLLVEAMLNEAGFNFPKEGFEYVNYDEHEPVITKGGNEYTWGVSVSYLGDSISEEIFIELVGKQSIIDECLLKLGEIELNGSTWSVYVEGYRNYSHYTNPKVILKDDKYELTLSANNDMTVQELLDYCLDVIY